jgi:hypothetical protein
MPSPPWQTIAARPQRQQLHSEVEKISYEKGLKMGYTWYAQKNIYHDVIFYDK